MKHNFTLFSCTLCLYNTGRVIKLPTKGEIDWNENTSSGYPQQLVRWEIF